MVVFHQNKNWGLVYAISAKEDAFKAPQNSRFLKKLVQRMERKRKIIDAPQKTFAGILPGVLLRNRLIQTTLEAKITVRCVYKAIHHVLEINNYPQDAAIILIGGKGFIGRRLHRQLNNREVYAIDLVQENAVPNQWASKLKGKKAILVNLSTKNALHSYIDDFWPELIVLNEVYPAPSQEEILAIHQKKCKLYHIVGIEGYAFPAFPGNYKGAVPCCAGQDLEELNILVKAL